ncbi:DUF6762 family protein [Clostridium sp. ATCC 25772]|uniref:DUF6762 family protein n=1 Tax=Clostridium sp. ATCC 25772 TaxID=1676991 RepID=UPI0007861B76|nr:DUF6762 family protein [Clostridium sp. ATCC 25772]
MEFSSLVLMEREKETNYLVKELGSYEVGEGAEYVTKLFYDGDEINLYFDTQRDVEEWEYTAIYDVFNEGKFEEKGFNIDVYDEEYNPTWIIKFQYDEEHEIIKEKLEKICLLIKQEMEKAFSEIKTMKID